MITSRLPLSVKDGETGYCDYGACAYHLGQNNEQFYFFNQVDIAEVYF